MEKKKYLLLAEIPNAKVSNATIIGRTEAESEIEALKKWTTYCLKNGYYADRVRAIEIGGEIIDI